jgi:hypothetical protein
MSAIQDNYDLFKKSVNNLLSKDKIELAIDYIVESLNTESLEFEEHSRSIVLFSQRSHRILKNSMHKISNASTIRIEKNNLTHDIVVFIDKVLTKEDVKLDTKLRYDDVIRMSENEQLDNRYKLLVGVTLLFSILSCFAFITVLAQKDMDTVGVFAGPTNRNDIVFVDNKQQPLKDIKISARVFTYTRFRYSKEDSIIAQNIYTREEIDVFKPTEWDIEQQWLGRNCSYDVDNNASLRRFLEVSDHSDIKPYVAEDQYKSLWLDTAYWKFMKEYFYKKNDLRTIIMPPEDQLSILVLEVEGADSTSGQLQLNYDNDQIAKAMRSQGGSKIRINVDKGRLIVGMLLTENSDILTFESENYEWKFSIIHIANPGFWRRPYNTFEDIAVLRYEVNSKSRETLRDEKILNY